MQDNGTYLAVRPGFIHSIAAPPAKPPAAPTEPYLVSYMESRGAFRSDQEAMGKCTKRTKSKRTVKFGTDCTHTQFYADLRRHSDVLNALVRSAIWDHERGLTLQFPREDRND